MALILLEGVTLAINVSDPISALIFLSSFQVVYLLPLALDLGLILIYLLLLLGLGSFLALKLVTNECSCTQSEGATNGSPCARMTNSGTN